MSITHKLKLLVMILALPLIAIFSACTPEEQAAFRKLSPEGQQAVLNHLQRQEATSRPSRDCYEAIDRHFPGDKNRMRKVVWRESNNNPSAQNSRSTAAGCTQMLRMHAHRFDAVGCSWAQRYNADCNLRAAADLYRAAGWSPWALTA